MTMNDENVLMNTQGDDLSELKKLFANYQQKQKEGTAKRGKSREEILAKYFVPRKTKEVFRILPPKPGRKHIEEAFFHVVTVNAAGGKKKHGTVLYCPAHNDPKVVKLDANGNPVLGSDGKPLLVHAPCPLCEKHKTLIAKQDPSIKGIKKENMTPEQLKIKQKNDEIYKEAIKWEAKKFYIIRGIDKGAEKDGVKFWRFKHNYKNQGTLDKLLPVLEEYMIVNKADFSDPVNGTDLSITMTESEFNGHIYKAVSAITYRGKSLLSQDPIVAKQWLDDNITWRDVFKPKTAPGMTPYEFLQSVANGTNPYWDDTDANNKHWVFPGRPDLEEAANTRRAIFDDYDDDFEYASDIYDNESVSISNITQSKVGKFNDDATDLGNEILSENKIVSNTQSSVKSDDIEDVVNDESEFDDYDDLPF